MIGIDMAFLPILDEILTAGPCLSLDKPEKIPVIKNKPTSQKIKKLNYSDE
jgi:hypothetical protein